MPKAVVKPFNFDIQIIDHEREISQRISMDEKIRLAKELKAKDLKQTNLIEEISDISGLDFKPQDKIPSLENLHKSDIYNKSPQGNFDDSIFKSNIDFINNTNQKIYDKDKRNNSTFIRTENRAKEGLLSS